MTTCQREGLRRGPAVLHTILSTGRKLAIPRSGCCSAARRAVDWNFGTADFTGLSMGGSDRVNGTWDAKPLGTKATIEYPRLGRLAERPGPGAARQGEQLHPNGVPVPGATAAWATPPAVDYRGFESSLDQRLFNGQLNFSGNLNQWRDNLQLTKAVTTGTFFYSGMVRHRPQRLAQPGPGLYPQPRRRPTRRLGFGDPHHLHHRRRVGLGHRTFNVSLGDTFALAAQQSLALNVNWVQVSQRDQDALRVSQDMDSLEPGADGLLHPRREQLQLDRRLGGSNSPAAVLAGLRP